MNVTQVLSIPCRTYLVLIFLFFSDIVLSQQTGSSYSSIKSEIFSTRSHLSQVQFNIDSVSKVFTNLLVDKLIFYWLGTPWSFEGHTSTPGEGEIACGYFVSTTLKDVGFNLDRYKFAQQLPIHEAKTLSLGKPLLEIYNTSVEKRIEILNDTLSEGIYFLGFDQSHVGYIQKKNGQLFVIHSNYIGAQGVVIEKIEESQVFSYYNRIYIADISRNKTLLKMWLNTEAIQIVTN